MSEPDWDNYKDFARSEFVCSCGCDRAEMSPAFMDRLQRVRSVMGEALVVSSGYRCPEYNARISSTGRNGPHTLGKAADIAVQGDKAHRLLKHAMQHGFTGIGVQQKGDGRFLHLDTLGGEYNGPRPWVWSY
jgi:uncharacterized protein YcbK (DUF882 family)